MMLADIPSEPVPIWIGIFVMCLTSIVGLALNVILIVKMLRNDSEKREVTISADVVGKPDFDHHVERNRLEHESIFSKIGGVERGAAANLQKAISEGNASREKLHYRMNELMSAIARLEGKLNR